MKLHQVFSTENAPAVVECVVGVVLETSLVGEVTPPGLRWEGEDRVRGNNLGTRRMVIGVANINYNKGTDGNDDNLCPQVQIMFPPRPKLETVLPQHREVPWAAGGQSF